MKRFISSLLLSLLAVHASTAWAFGVAHVSAAAPEAFQDRCQVGSIKCEKQEETELVVCSAEPLAIQASVADGSGKTAGGYHSFGTAGVSGVSFPQQIGYQEVSADYHFEGKSFGSDYVGIVKIQV